MTEKKKRQNLSENSDRKKDKTCQKVTEKRKTEPVIEERQKTKKDRTCHRRMTKNRKRQNLS